MEEKEQSVARVINLAEVEVPQPVAVVGRKRWVDYGFDNLYPQFIQHLFINSPTNNAIITSTYQLIYGEGLNTNDVVKQQQVNSIISQADAKQAAFDLKTFGYTVLFVVLENNKKRIKRITTSSSKLWRSGLKNEEGKVTEWWYSENWNNYQYNKNKPTPYPIYDKFSKEIEQVYIVRPFVNAGEYYPDIDYAGSINYIMLEEEIGIFHIANINNGLFPGMLINFNNGVPSPEEQDRVELNVKEKWGGAKRAGKIIVSFNDSAEAATTIDPVQQTDLDKMFEFLSKETTQKVMIGHRVTSPLLFGIREGGGLGSNKDELRVAFNLYGKIVVKPYQNLLIDSYEELLKRNGIIVELEYKPLTLIDDEEEVEISEPETPQPEKSAIMSRIVNAEQLVDHDDNGYSEKIYDIYYKPINWRGQPMTKNVFQLSEAKLVNDVSDRELDWKRMVFLKEKK